MATNFGSINLLTASIQPQGRWDRIYSWTVNTAKYIIIAVEIVVLIAIGVRFYLDGQINDLDREITSQKELLQSRQQDDSKVRFLAQSLDSIASMESNEYSLAIYYKKILDLIPSSVEVTTISIDALNGVSITGRINGYDKLLLLENNVANADFITDGSENFTTNQQSAGSILFTLDFKLKITDDAAR